jgi:hypothetical protein
MNAYLPVQTWRQVMAMLVMLIMTAVVLAAVVGLGWLIWDYVIGGLLPYSDPEPPNS